MRLITFSESQEHTTSSFKILKILKPHDIIQFNTLKLICLYYNDKLPLKITINESVNRIISEVESWFSYR